MCGSGPADLHARLTKFCKIPGARAEVDRKVIVTSRSSSVASPVLRIESYCGRRTVELAFGLDPSTLLRAGSRMRPSLARTQPVANFLPTILYLPLANLFAVS